MKVLSLFDGMSCGQIALKQLGIISEVYYASEVDKHTAELPEHNSARRCHPGRCISVGTN